MDTVSGFSWDTWVAIYGAALASIHAVVSLGRWLIRHSADKAMMKTGIYVRARVIQAVPARYVQLRLFNDSDRWFPVRYVRFEGRGWLGMWRKSRPYTEDMSTRRMKPVGSKEELLGCFKIEDLRRDLGRCGTGDVRAVFYLGPLQRARSAWFKLNAPEDATAVPVKTRVRRPWLRRWREEYWPRNH